MIHYVSSVLTLFLTWESDAASQQRVSGDSSLSATPVSAVNVIVSSSHALQQIEGTRFIQLMNKHHLLCAIQQIHKTLRLLCKGSQDKDDRLS